MYNKINIMVEGNLCLKKIAKDVSLPLTSVDKKILTDLMNHLIVSQIPELAEKYNVQPGVGIAAPQINISKRMFCILATDSDDNLHKYYCVNPKIISKSKQMTYLSNGEGCLSVKRKVFGIVQRHKTITVKSGFYDPETDRVTVKKIKLTDFISIVFQHEYDHLDGILFVDKLIAYIENSENLSEC